MRDKENLMRVKKVVLETVVEEVGVVQHGKMLNYLVELALDFTWIHRRAATARQLFTAHLTA